MTTTHLPASRMPALADTPPVPQPEHDPDTGQLYTAREGAAAHAQQGPETDTPVPRTRWRCAPGTIAVVAALMLIVGIVMPAAAGYGLVAGVIGIGPVQIVLVSVVGALALLTLFYGWRLALHPRLLIDGDMVLVINPFRQHDVHFDEITMIAPGGDGLLIATRYETVEAWCVQKSALATRAGRPTRADRICDQLWDVWDRYHHPTDDPASPVRISFARPGRQDELTELEQSANVAQLSHIFPPEDFPYPVEDVRKKWKSVLTDRTKHTLIAQLDGDSVGYAAFDDDTVLHLGVHADHQRRGIGSALLEAALNEVYADAGNRHAYLWVLEENHGARAFYTAHGWTETGEIKPSEFAPYPNQIEMARPNPHSARRSR